MSHKKRQRSMSLKKHQDRDPDKLRPDVNELAFKTVQAALGKAEKPVPPDERTDADKDSEAVERGRKGGLKGGKARADVLTPEELSRIAKQGAEVRWAKQHTGKNDPNP